MNFPFPQNAVLTQISLAYTNATMVADLVLPRISVGGRLFKWNKYDFTEMTTLPDTTVGRKGVPNEVEFGYTEVEASVRDFGLDDVVPVEDIESAPAGYDPLGHATEGITELLMLDREKRVADLVFNPATYPAANKTTLTNTDRWSDYANSNPLNDMLTVLDGMVMRPNTLVLGNNVWSALRRHPKLIAAVYPLGGNASEGGLITRQQLADLLEISEIIVGQAWVNAAKPGQPASMTRLWGKAAAFLHKNPLARNQKGMTFGYTAQFGTRIAGVLDEPKVGLRGARRVRAGESVREIIAAPDVGYLFDQAIA